ncbi:MAG TPA: metal-dependent transcriptional regulator [bacterium]|nr:metal-dependent transcriptional regulator [bacterium]
MPDHALRVTDRGSRVLTQAIEDYMKAIYKLQQEGAAATTNAIAERLDVAPASVSNMLKKLARLRLVEHTPYHGVQLTDGGQKVALEVIRHHRLIELYLARNLGISLDKVDEEAERLEHVISEELEERIAQSLGEPTRDPHGDPIPTREGDVEDLHHPVLADLGPGQTGIVSRVSDRDPAVLRDLASERLLPGESVRVVAVHDDGALSVETKKGTRRVRSDLAKAVFIEL